MKFVFCLLVFISNIVFAQLPSQPVIKNGSCPSGYISSGDYCLASSNNSRQVIQKQGSCPSGYVSSGEYCLSNK